MRRFARVGTLAIAFTAACSQRRCSDDTGSSAARDAGVENAPGRTPAMRARCNQEVARGAVATIPGTGALDAMIPACDGDTLAVYALRGHTLTRLTRSLTPGSTFRLPDPVATGADRLGALAFDGVNGPLAWRSPTVLLDEGVGDEWWVAWLEGATDGGSARVHRGSAVMPTGAEGLGVIAPIGRRGDAVEVLATIARQGGNPQLVRATVPTGGEELERFAQDPPSIGEGELKAWEGTTHTAVVFAIADDGGSVLRAVRVVDTPGEGAHAIGEVPMARSHVLVSPTGIALPGGDALFAYNEFDVVRRGAGPCLALDETLCVQPGAVRMLRVAGTGGARVYDVMPSGLIDTVVLEHDSTVLALYVNAIGETRAQHAVRFDAATGAVRRVTLAPSDEMPPLDHPTLVRCGGEAWLAAEVVVEGTDAGRARETAVMAVPAACIVQGE